MRKSGINPLVHYIRYGKNEGRVINPSEGARYQGYSDWVQKYDNLTKFDRDLIHAHIASFGNYPLFSIALLITKDLKNTEWMKRSISSVVHQIYRHWQLNIFCDKENNLILESILREFGNERHNISVSYVEINQDLAPHLNTAIKSSQGEFFTRLLPGVVLREHALYLVANEINNFPEADVIYTDEDHLNNQGERCHPFFKPDWNPDLFFSLNLLSNIAIFKKDVIRKTGGYQHSNTTDIDWDLALRIIDAIPNSHIRHIPHVCVHCLYNKSTPDTKEAHFQTIKSHFERINKDVALVQTDCLYWHLKYPIPDPAPLVSILIPTKNQYDLISNCIQSIRKNTQYSNYEILIINNQFDDPGNIEQFISIEKGNNTSLINYNRPFNYSAINNFAAQHAKGEVLLFLNDDIEVISPDWLDEMVGHALREEIGAVGAMLYFPYDTIQHAGIILYPDMIAGHAFYLQARGSHGQNDRARLIQNYSAVTGACIAVEKSKFQKVGGFDEEKFPIAYNDVDLCLKLRKAGYENLWTPYAELYHLESVSRGLDNTEEKQNRLKRETDFLIQKWGSIIANDPAYNPNLKSHPFFSLADPPRSIKPWKSGNPIKPSN